jgi:hypothetical protein
MRSGLTGSLTETTSSLAIGGIDSDLFRGRIGSWTKCSGTLTLVVEQGMAVSNSRDTAFSFTLQNRDTPQVVHASQRAASLSVHVYMYVCACTVTYWCLRTKQYRCLQTTSLDTVPDHAIPRPLQAAGTLPMYVFTCTHTSTRLCAHRWR